MAIMQKTLDIDAGRASARAMTKRRTVRRSGTRPADGARALEIVSTTGLPRWVVRFRESGGEVEAWDQYWSLAAFPHGAD